MKHISRAHFEWPGTASPLWIVKSLPFRRRESRSRFRFANDNSRTEIYRVGRVLVTSRLLSEKSARRPKRRNCARRGARTRLRILRAGSRALLARSAGSLDARQRRPLPLGERFSPYLAPAGISASPHRYPKVMPGPPRRGAFLRPTIPYKNKLPQAGVFLRFCEDLRRSATSGPGGGRRDGG